ncbi:immunoglobulin-like domain-containing protein [Xylocopilactobacillus apis]|uniref:Pesticidal crystal protein Cry22Aa Ig-like domain-containing protein n=1 Tax=Xylocopilactobacillus apis TaxID=2932183 RepID=A0AAU9CZ59_9LACO|nr:immunoglobulin-like domain-containing protein [Xylocopilactobacillus apis]BDR55511.1 hypothetical protein KIMC2_00730 [Xylocopilactobacillus apis]
MKHKLTNVVSSALLMLSPITSAVTSTQVVKADVNWDYDVESPGLGDYDKLLQNAGPSDGTVDWYPAKNGASTNASAQEVVKQLIDLSIATNDKDSEARKALFNDTTGSNDKYKEVYDKYSLAFGLIAQILDFNNAKPGTGAYLKQGAQRAEDPNDDPVNSQGSNVFHDRVVERPKPGEGKNISDVLGKAFFGDADDGYAQIYVNGYDNVAQNEANMIRETTSSITLVAQSKQTGKKATAIFKLNNKTLPKPIKNSKFNNYVDHSFYAMDGDGVKNVAGLNMTTAPQSVIDSIKFKNNSTFWVEGADGAGTIVVPRGTTAKEIANLITKRKLASNNSFEETVPMKAVQAAKASGDAGAGNKIVGTEKTWHDVSYSHQYQETRSSHNSEHDKPNMGLSNLGNDTLAGQYNHAPALYGLNGPDQKGNDNFFQYREYNNVFNSKEGFNRTIDDFDKDLVSSPSLYYKYKFPDVTGPKKNPTTDAWFGGGSRDLHMIDTNDLFKNSYQANTASKSADSIPNVEESEGTPYDQDPAASKNAENLKKSDGTPLDSNPAAIPGQKFSFGDVDAPKKAFPNKATNVGKVKHLFQPSSYFKEAYDANHFVVNDPKIENNSYDEIVSQISNNGSFTNDGKLQKSFSYDAPVSYWMYKSYNNPYSTVMSSGGASSIDGKKVEYDEVNHKSNSTIQPQEKLDLNNPDDPNPTQKEGSNIIDLKSETEAKLVEEDQNSKTYVFTGVYPAGTKPLDSVNGKPSTSNLKINIPGTQKTIEMFPALGSVINVFGGVGTNYDKSISGMPLDFTRSMILYDGNADISRKVDNIYFNDFNNPFAKPVWNSDTSTTYLSVPYDKLKMWRRSDYFVQTWDKNTRVKDKDGNFISNPQPLIYNKNILPNSTSDFSEGTLGQVDSPNFESKYYMVGSVKVDNRNNTIQKVIVTHRLTQVNESKRAYFNSNLYNNPKGEFSKNGSHKNNSRFFVSQDFSVGPVSSDMISDAGPEGSGVTIDGVYYPYGKNDPKGKSAEDNAAKILELSVKHNNPKQNAKNGDVIPEFTDKGTDGNDYESNDGTGYKLISVAEAAKKQEINEDELATELSRVTHKDVDWVKRTKWVEATLPRLRRNTSNGHVRINVVTYDKAAVSAPSKETTKPSFSTTDISSGNDPFNVKFRPYTTTYDDGAVLKAGEVPETFKNLLSPVLVAGNPDLIGSDNKLQQILVSAFLDSWQQNDGSFKQTDGALGVSSPLYLYGGFGISNSDTKHSYMQWPKGYTDNSGEYQNAVAHFSGDFYRGGRELKTAGSSIIEGIPMSALKADTSKVDLSKAGIYPVVYTYTDPKNSKNSASITVPITVKDSSAPVFVFKGMTDQTISVGEAFKPTEYKVVGSWSIFNNYKGDYDKLPNYEGIAKNVDGTPQVTVSGIVDTNTPGIYQLTYRATSTSGAVTTMVRNITVLAKNGSSANEWQTTDYKAVGYINYVPGYGISVYNAPAGKFTGNRLKHGTAWKISQKAVNSKGEISYRVGKNQWVSGKYVSFSPIKSVIPLKGKAVIVYKKGYGVNLWKSASTTGGYYPGRKMMHGSKWKVTGKQNGFYRVGKDQWLEGLYVGFTED